MEGAPEAVKFRKRVHMTADANFRTATPPKMIREFIIHSQSLLETLDAIDI
jgi:hypothetical protein